MPQAAHLRKCASTPALHSLGVPAANGGDDGLEVYVVLRNFQELFGGVFHRLPLRVRDGVRDAGVCHYMTVFRKARARWCSLTLAPAGVATSTWGVARCPAC